MVMAIKQEERVRDPEVSEAKIHRAEHMIRIGAR